MKARNGAKRQDANPRHWTPLQMLDKSQTTRRPEIVAETMRHYGIAEDEAKALLDEEEAKCLFFINNLYQVSMSRTFVDWFGVEKDIVQLCIRRRDGAMVWDWRHFQQIKNELCGEEVEGLQLFPAESRKVDTSNKWHIWIVADGTKMPFGWQQRDVQDASVQGVPGLRQRAL
jgi:hypothetical protein